MSRRLIDSLEREADAFAVKVVRLGRLAKARRETIIAGQLTRSGTSIGANIAEGRYPQTRGDYISKLGIALKEAAETHYWIRLLENLGLVEPDGEFATIRLECEAIIAHLRRAVAYARRINARKSREA